MTAQDDELTAWERDFLDGGSEPRGYQPKAAGDVPGEPAAPPPGAAGPSARPDPPPAPEGSDA
ncbi:hypothetical protein OHA98_01905 [Streptomyces sp. NBC_00654]|uniref:hypothetical protein n=1 Tax=Streptomyces sp. NBC_00654 TaxID=2975799 RepID=UPI00224E940D|nr:hypothetical protein [Streptomyces sp. NBC_00654]MCX4963589.1 hypothetical protein [Streptomyces sp. NBC_00654]